MAKVIYLGIFFDPSEVRGEFPSDYEKVTGDHVTLAFSPTPEEVEAFLPMVGKEVQVEFTEVVDDGKCKAVAVRLPEGVACKNACPHVTIAHTAMVKPVYSNTLLASKDAKRVPVKVTLTGKFDTFPRS